MMLLIVLGSAIQIDKPFSLNNALNYSPQQFLTLSRRLTCARAAQSAIHCFEVYKRGPAYARGYVGQDGETGAYTPRRAVRRDL